VTRGSAQSSPEPDRRVVLRPVRLPTELADVRTLFADYRAWLVGHREVTNFPDSILATGLERFDRERAGLPGEYAPPTGELLVAYVDGRPVGCAALRSLDHGTMELKRVFVRAEARKMGVGRRLTTRSVELATQRGAQRVVLDTLPGMKAAIALYQELGFRPIPPYWPNPVEIALYFEIQLAPRIQPAPRSSG
jgi:putative acetyltransferase